MDNGIKTGDPRGFNKGRSSVKAPEFDKHQKKVGGNIDRNVEEISIKMKTIVRKSLMIKKIIRVELCCFFVFFIAVGTVSPDS